MKCVSCDREIYYDDFSEETSKGYICGDCYFSNDMNRNILFSEDKRHRYRNANQWYDLAKKVNGKLIEKYRFFPSNKPFQHNVDKSWHKVPD